MRFNKKKILLSVLASILGGIFLPHIKSSSAWGEVGNLSDTISECQTLLSFEQASATRHLIFTGTVKELRVLKRNREEKHFLSDLLERVHNFYNNGKFKKYAVRDLPVTKWDPVNNIDENQTVINNLYIASFVVDKIWQDSASMVADSKVNVLVEWQPMKKGKINFKLGKEYLVYGWGMGKGPIGKYSVVYPCSRTGLVENRQDDINKLNDIRAFPVHKVQVVFGNIKF